MPSLEAGILGWGCDGKNYWHQIFSFSIYRTGRAQCDLYSWEQKVLQHIVFKCVANIEDFGLYALWSRNRCPCNIAHLGSEPESASSYSLPCSGSRNWPCRKYKENQQKGQVSVSGKQAEYWLSQHNDETVEKATKKNDQLPEYQPVIDKAWAKEWVVFSEPSFADSGLVIKYLGQYTHRVAITNNRIRNIDTKNVSFNYKDYRDNAKLKLTTLTGIEFLRRFSMHILPKGFVKIRYYGMLSNRFCKQTAMYRKTKQDRSKETVQQRIERLTDFDVCQCPYCKKGHMHTIEVLPRIRSPGNFLQPKQGTIKV